MNKGRFHPNLPLSSSLYKIGHSNFRANIPYTLRHNL